jgi:hypothetical protein
MRAARSSSRAASGEPRDEPGRRFHGRGKGLARHAPPVLGLPGVASPAGQRRPPELVDGRKDDLRAGSVRRYRSGVRHETAHVCERMDELAPRPDEPRLSLLIDRRRLLGLEAVKQVERVEPLQRLAQADERVGTRVGRE